MLMDRFKLKSNLSVLKPFDELYLYLAAIVKLQSKMFLSSLVVEHNAVRIISYYKLQIQMSAVVINART